MCKSLCVLFHVYMCMYRRAFQWQHFGSPAEVLLHTKAHFPPLNCEVQQFIFTGAWWFVNGCEDTDHAVIHGLSRTHLGVSFSAPYHYKSLYIITAGNWRCFVAKWLRRTRITGAFFFAAAKIEICCVWAAALNLVLVHRGCVVFGLFATLYYCACFPVTGTVTL